MANKHTNLENNFLKTSLRETKTALNTVRCRCLLYIAGLGAGLARSLDCRFVWLISDLMSNLDSF